MVPKMRMVLLNNTKFFGDLTGCARAGIGSHTGLKMPGPRRNRRGSGKSGNTQIPSEPLESLGCSSDVANQEVVDAISPRDPPAKAEGDCQEAVSKPDASATDGSTPEKFCPELGNKESKSSQSLPGGPGHGAVPREVGSKLEELREILLEGADYRPIELLNDILKMLDQQPVMSADGLINETSPGEKTMRRWMSRPTKADASTQVHTVPGDEEAFAMSDALSIDVDTDDSSEYGGVFVAENLLDDDGGVAHGNGGLFGGLGALGGVFKREGSSGSGPGDGELDGANPASMGGMGNAATTPSKPAFMVPKLPLHTLGVHIPESPQQPLPSPSSRQSTVHMSPRPPRSPGMPAMTPRSSSLRSAAMQRKTPRGGSSPSSSFWKTSQAAEERISALEEQLEIQKQLSARGSTHINHSLLSRRLEEEFESREQEEHHQSCPGSLTSRGGARRIELNGVDERQVPDPNDESAVNGKGGGTIDNESLGGWRLDTWEDIAGIRGGEVVDWGEIPQSVQSNKRLFMF